MELKNQVEDNDFQTEENNKGLSEKAALYCFLYYLRRNRLLLRREIAQGVFEFQLLLQDKNFLQGR